MDDGSTAPPALLKNSKRWRRIVGSACIVVGLPGIILPIIPGIPLLIAGFALLSTEDRRVRSHVDGVDPQQSPEPPDGTELKPRETEEPPSDKRSYMRRRT